MTTMLEIITPDPMNLPDVVMTAQGNLAAVQLTTIRNIQYISAVSGIVPRLNMATASVEYFIDGASAGAEQAEQENAELTFLDLCTYCRIRQQEQIRAIVGNLAKFSAFHPMEDWLKGLAWDGQDRAGKLIDSVKTDNALWPTYLENWLVQVVEGVCGWRDRELKKSLPHVLVLVGGQGIGKSHWLKNLGGMWFKGEAELHLSSPSGKDHQLEALKFPMVELSELDGIFRKVDISHMKAFISREEDSIRAPYDRRALVRPRMTSFCGSVNEAEFLTDTSGSRRFWPVQVESIDWSVRVDLAQLWAQAFAMWAENSDFNLTAEEDIERAATALDVHTTVTPVQETVQEYLRLHVGNARFSERAMTRTEIMDMLFGKRNHWPREVNQVGKVVADLLGKHRTIDGKQRSWLLPYNEFAADRATWPDKISLKSV